MRRHAFNLILPPSQHGPMLSKPFGQVMFLVFEAIIQRGAARAVSNIDVDAVQLHQQLGHFVQPILCRHMQQIVSVVVLQRGEGSVDAVRAERRRDQCVHFMETVVAAIGEELFVNDGQRSGGSGLRLHWWW